MERDLRKWHRIISFIFLLPIVIISITGVILINRSRLTWVQPALPIVSKMKINEMVPTNELSFDKASTFKKVIYLPSKGIITARTGQDEEIIFSGKTGEIISKHTRRTSWLIRIHEGSYWGKAGRDFIFFPASLALIFLAMSGLILITKHYNRQRRKRL